MKFVARDPGEAAEASAGGGERGLLREAAVLFGAFLLLALGSYAAIGWVTERTLPLISVEREQAWFSKFTPGAALEAELSPEFAARRDRVAKLLERLAADPAVPRLNYRLHVLEGEAPNAFAFPGGAVGVTRGLIEMLDDEVAIAFVLGHELGHFAQRDHLRGLGRRLGRSLVWAIIFGDAGDFVGARMAQLLDLRHSREQESSADLFGVELVHRIHGTTEGTDRLFAWLAEQERSPAWTAMIATHPHSRDRLADLRAHAARLAGKN